MTRVYVAGTGLTPVSKGGNAALADLFVEAATQALRDADKETADALYVGNMLGIYSKSQGHLGPYMADKLGLQGSHAVSIESACSSAGVAITQAFQGIKSGSFDTALVGGVEKMTQMQTPDVTYGLSFAESVDHVKTTGITFAGLNALTARLYMERYSVPHRDVAAFSVLCHRNALNSPHAQFHKEISTDDVLSSPLIADPLRLYDACPVSDGAAALLLTSEDGMRNGAPEIELAGSAAATQLMSLHERDDMLKLGASDRAARKTLEQAGLDLEDVDVAEVHDAYDITGILALESIGFSEPGEATQPLLDGEFSLDGSLPVNTFGGLKARGHPVGATGAYQAVEAVSQLRREAGDNQVANDPRVALTQNVGGVDSSAAVQVFKVA